MATRFIFNPPVETDSETEILNLQQELAKLFGTVTVQRGVRLH